VAGASDNHAGRRTGYGWCRPRCGACLQQQHHPRARRTGGGGHAGGRVVRAGGGQPLRRDHPDDEGQRNAADALGESLW